ncbi:MAG: hypothetical protein LQ346_006713 [Caloplaca aetnensis]|nr:MAG: hypothetical protein LQ346_006713 [Caloplaca aetnensis]
MLSLITSLLVCALISISFLCRRRWETSENSDKPRACKQIGVRSRGSHSLLGTIQRLLSLRGTVPGRGTQGPKVGVVESLYVYPIKSCRAVEVEEAENLSVGFKYDRQYTFAEFRGDASITKGSESAGWHFVTQRKYGKLANIIVEVWVPDPDSLDYAPGEPNVLSEGVLLVRYPDSEGSTSKHKSYKSFEIPFNPTEGQIRNQGYTTERMTIWKDSPESLLITSTDRADCPPWIKDIQTYIGCSKPFALFRVATGHERQVFRNAPREEQLGYQSVVGFADAYPLHILGLASVADLDERLRVTAPEIAGSSASRFRANIYFKGHPAYAEDSWRRIRIGQQIYHVACRTTRCELPNTNQLSGKKHLKEPSKTIRSYRDIDEGAGPGMACFGMQMVPAAERAIIRVGDEIEILETGEHRYIRQ